VPPGHQTRPPTLAPWKAKEGDYLLAIAQRAGVPIETLLADNLDAIKDLDAPLAGTNLVLCAPGSGAAGAGDDEAPPSARGSGGAAAAGGGLAVGAPGAGDPKDAQLRALMDLAQALNADLPWTVATGRRGGYCEWEEVRCDGGSNVVAVKVPATQCKGYKCGGRLPPAGVLRAMPSLSKLELGALDLGGSLPDSWGLAPQLQEVAITGNPKLAGPLPAAWAALTQLRRLDLS
jgi:hypothetical protein